MPFTMTFGRHRGRTLEWVFFHDPGYVWWMIDNNVHEDRRKFSSPARQRFDQLVRRAQHLRIPGRCPWCGERPITRMFWTEHTSGGLAVVNFDCDECHPTGGSLSVPSVPSFYTPDLFRRYDKFGAYLLIREIKRAYFGDPSYRMTQRRMEAFFDDSSNFVNF